MIETKCLTKEYLRILVKQVIFIYENENLCKKKSASIVFNLIWIEKLC